MRDLLHIDFIKECDADHEVLRYQKTARKLTAVTNNELKGTGITSVQFFLLECLEDGISHKEILERIGAERTTILRNFNLLINLGLVEKNKCGNKVKYQLSTKGKNKLRGAIPIMEKLHRDVVRSENEYMGEF